MKDCIYKSDFLNCDLGIYKIYWKSGGSSVAAIGNDYEGNRWVAPANWTCDLGGNPTSMLSKHADEIEMMLKFA